MKKLMAAVCAASLLSAFAEEKKGEAEIAEEKAPILWGFGNYGIYSGYQLYGSLVNREPTLQGYVEVNANIPMDLGYLGVGVWNNSDLTCERKDSYGRIFMTSHGEVDAVDVITSRRVYVTLIPSMDKDPKELKSLGQIVFRLIPESIVTDSLFRSG